MPNYLLDMNVHLSKAVKGGGEKGSHYFNNMQKNNDQESSFVHKSMFETQDREKV